MTSRYVVIDSEGSQTWSDKHDCPESFVSFKGAEKKARELAVSDPGKSVSIFEKVATVIADVSKPRTAKLGKTP